MHRIDRAAGLLGFFGIVLPAFVALPMGFSALGIGFTLHSVAAPSAEPWIVLLPAFAVEIGCVLLLGGFIAVLFSYSAYKGGAARAPNLPDQRLTNWEQGLIAGLMCLAVYVPISLAALADDVSNWIGMLGSWGSGKR